jgi:hypothetical protein
MTLVMLRMLKEELFEDSKVVIRIRKSKNNRQHNGQKKNTNNDLQYTTQKTKNWATRTPLKIGENSWFTVSDWPRCIVLPSLIHGFWLTSLYCLSFFDSRFLIDLVVLFFPLLFTRNNQWKSSSRATSNKHRDDNSTWYNIYK